MTRSIEIHELMLTDSCPESRLVNRRRRWAACLTVSAVTCAVTGLLGVVFAVSGLFDGGASMFGIAMLAVTFVLMFFTAHCSDKIDKANAEIRKLKCTAEGR